MKQITATMLAQKAEQIGATNIRVLDETGVEFYTESGYHVAQVCPDGQTVLVL
jgi:hypothetical protein